MADQQSPVQQEESNKAEETRTPASQDEYRLDRIYHVVKDTSSMDDLILSMTVMENPPTPGK